VLHSCHQTKGKGKATPHPADHVAPINDGLSEAARYLMDQKAHLAQVAVHPAMLAQASSRALEDLMSPLKTRRSHGSDASSILGSIRSEKSEPGDATFVKELEMSVHSGPSWLVAGSKRMPGQERHHHHHHRHPTAAQLGHRPSRSNGSIGSLDGDDESYSNSSGSSSGSGSDSDGGDHDGDVSMRNRPIPSWQQSPTSSTSRSRAPNRFWNQNAMPPPSQVPFPADPFAPGPSTRGDFPVLEASVPDSNGAAAQFQFPPDPFSATTFPADAHVHAYPQNRNPSLPSQFPPMPFQTYPGQPSTGGMDVPMDVFLRGGPLDTIPSDSEDGRSRSRDDKSSSRRSNSGHTFSSYRHPHKQRQQHQLQNQYQQQQQPNRWSVGSPPSTGSVHSTGSGGSGGLSGQQRSPPLSTLSSGASMVSAESAASRLERERSLAGFSSRPVVVPKPRHFSGGRH
jgi:hypothetical protein